jgi:glyoxylase-like metal-dependent hydrolase (beta-lactamase superfamily II)
MTASHPSVRIVDCHYTAPEKAAVYLVAEGDRLAIVDANTNHAVPRILEAIVAGGHQPDQVEYIIITHVHLDHAGGTAALLEQCPNATVLAHPKAARHLADPTRLIAGAKAVYGEAEFDALYGTITGVPESRIRIMEDEEALDWGTRTLTFLYTKGHASHHFCIHDTGCDGVFAGDAFGLGRDTADRPGPPFMVCSSSPPEFDPEEARRSVDKILATGAARAFITHYGQFDQLPERAEQLVRSIGLMEDIGRAAAESDLSGEPLFDFCHEQVGRAFREHLAWCGVDDVEVDWAWLANDLYLNSLGLQFYAERIREAG